MRIALGLEYNGSPFKGWQRQKNGISVQQVVEEALSAVADHNIQTVCAGRTDTAVHASYQVIHFDTHKERSERAWVLGVNRNMPDSVSVLWAKQVGESFHARFGAQARSYRYIIFNRTIRSALLGPNVTWWRRSLDAEKMQQASAALVGRHDFSAYRALHCQSKSPVRIVHHISIQRKDDYLYLDIRASGFLYHMVRNITGVLMAIGQGDRDITWAGDVLKKKDRAQGGVTAPPYGLYLCSVEYPDEYALPAPQSYPVFT